MKAGYSVVDFEGIGVTIASNTGSQTVTATEDIVNKLMDTLKPAMVHNLDMTVGGGAMSVCGFTMHSISAGVHTHTINKVTLQPVVPNQVTVTVTA